MLSFIEMMRHQMIFRCSACGEFPSREAVELGTWGFEAGCWKHLHLFGGAAIKIDAVPSGAIFSDCRKFRYVLWRTWSAKPTVLFLMLNPSTADEIKNDPTVERCERRARSYGFGGLVVCNIFAFRATDPFVMKAARDPVGPDNTAWIVREAERADQVICAWGSHGDFRGRDQEIRKLLFRRGRPLHHLGMTSKGQPKHPLYISYAMRPKEWTAPASFHFGDAAEGQPGDLV